MRPTNQGYRMLLAVLICVAAVAGCATFRNTLAQDQALERWQMCQGKAPDVTLKEVRPDGQIWFLYSSPSGLAKAHECLREAAVTQRQRATTPGANVAVVQSAAVAETSSKGGAAVAISSLAAAPVWKIGDEWAYRYQSSSADGTYVWSVVRSETMDGMDCYVIKTGDRELFYRKQDLAFVRDVVSGVVVGRATPPKPDYQWPLTVGGKWEVAYTSENWRDKRTQQLSTQWEILGEETITVPAGTFQTLKILARNARTGTRLYELWYAPAVKQWVKIREWLEAGERTREMTEYRLR